jgi:RNA polymerase sigma-70 factor (ECF subfamily)
MNTILQATAEYNKKYEQLTLGYSDNHKKLQNYAFSRTHNTATSSDLVQETFLKTWRFILKGGDIKIMEAFLYHVLNDLIIDEYRKKKSVSLDNLLEKGFEPGQDTRERLMNTSDGKALVALLKDLPTNYRKMLRMRYIQELSLLEISLITGKTKNTIAVQIHRGLQKLRVLYLVSANEAAIQ